MPKGWARIENSRTTCARRWWRWAPRKRRCAQPLKLQPEKARGRNWQRSRRINALQARECAPAAALIEARFRLLKLARSVTGGALVLQTTPASRSVKLVDTFVDF